LRKSGTYSLPIKQPYDRYNCLTVFLSFNRTAALSALPIPSIIRREDVRTKEGRREQGRREDVCREDGRREDVRRKDVRRE
jgi:hypothetical protein